MFGHVYDHDIIEKAVSAFGTLFNDVTLLRKDSDGNETHRIRVPIRYVQKKHWFIRNLEDGTLLHNFAKTVPRFGFELSEMSPDPNRRLPQMNKNHTQSTGDKRNFQYMGAPVNLMFSLYVETENMVDLTQILERVFPYFRPSLTVTSNIMPALNLEEDLSFSLVSATSGIEYQGEIGNPERRSYQLDFICKVNLRGHVTEQGLIREVITNIYSVSDLDDTANEDADVIITVVPEPIDADPGDVYTEKVTITETEEI